MLTSSCRRGFLNYDAFYRSIGIGERIFTDDFDPPFDVDRFEATHSDALFLDAALGAHMKRIADDAAPRFLYALTNFNHGPHSRRLVAPGRFEGERAFAEASLPDDHYAEYYARLAETAATWNRLKSELAARFPGRPMLIVHYGDHQPVMARRIEAKLKLAPDPRRQFRTFYAIESLNDALRSICPRAGPGPRHRLSRDSGPAAGRPAARRRSSPRARACSTSAATPISRHHRNGNAASTAPWSISA